MSSWYIPLITNNKIQIIVLKFKDPILARDHTSQQYSNFKILPNIIVLKIKINYNYIQMHKKKKIETKSPSNVHHCRHLKISCQIRHTYRQVFPLLSLFDFLIIFFFLIISLFDLKYPLYLLYLVLQTSNKALRSPHFTRRGRLD